MLLVGKEEVVSPLARSSAWNDEEIFFSTVGVSLAALETHRGPGAAQGKKPHHGIFSNNPALRIGGVRAKWSGTHQDSEMWWRNTASGSALDANGNTLTDPQGRGYSWDFENRLVQAVVPGQNGGTTTFKYDPFGRRIQKSGPLGTTNYVYDADAVIEELDGGGGVLARNAHARNIDEPLAEFRSATTNYYQADGLGSITSLTNASAAAAATFSYDAFGNLSGSTGSLTNPFRYTARESDSETGLYYYRARYYDPRNGRFISEDPIRFAGGANFYRYANNRPNRFVDPLGLSDQDVQAIIQAINNAISSMNANGQRLNNGTLNNFLSGLYTMTGGLLGRPYLGCGRQTDMIIGDLTPLIPKLDDLWTFNIEDAFLFPFYHQWGLATSSNPNDPAILFDPLNGVVGLIPPNGMPGEIHPIK